MYEQANSEMIGLTTSKKWRNLLSKQKKQNICNVRQFNIKLTCYSCWPNSVKTRLRCSRLDFNYTLQVLQQVVNSAYCKIQTATYFNVVQGFVRLYATLHILTCVPYTFTYLWPKSLYTNIYTCAGYLNLHLRSPQRKNLTQWSYDGIQL